MADTPRPRAHGNFQVSWGFLTLVALVLLAAFALAPNLKVLIDQRQEIARVEAEIALQEQEIAQMHAQVARWEDPRYVQAQARDRLLYVFPGEQSFVVIDDREGPVPGDIVTPIDDELELQHVDWASAGYRSIIEAGLTEAPAEAWAP